MSEESRNQQPETRSPEEAQRENFRRAQRGDSEGFRFFVLAAVFVVAVTVGSVAVLTYCMMRMGI